MLATPPYHPPAIASPSHVRPSTSPLHPNSSGSSSSGSPAATTSSHGRRTSTSSHSTPADDPADSFVNPVFSIGERVQNGELDEVHLFKVCENDIIIREGTPPSFPHPSTWHEHPHRHDKGKGKGTTLVVGGHGEDGAVERVEDFRDEGIENSKRDALRMTAHEWKAGINEDLGRTQSKGKGRRLSSSSHSALDRVPSRESSAATDERAQHPTDDSSTSYFSTASYQNGVAAYSNGRSSTPPRNGAPVVNAPGHLVTNSRAIPSPTSSPVRLIPTGALTKPLHLSASSSLFPPSGSSSTAPLPRRSNTTGSSVPVLSSTVSRSPTRKNVPLRSHSFSQHPQHDSSVAESLYFPTNEGAPKDEVEESIAAQADVIRKERQSKRLEKAQEEEENAKASGSGLSLRRRSTRAGSHAEVGGPGTGVLVGNLIGQDHANYVLMYNMLTGIRIGVSRCQAKLKRPLTDADYTARHKFSFDIVGNELTPSTKYDFKFKDYAPWVFRELREYFYLDPSDYLVSLTAKYILSELGSPGKSGSFFYFSRDYRFIIKTIRHSEHKFLRSILKEYHEYIKKNPHTLLSRFYGLHRVKLPRGKKIHFVIMNNLFPPHRDIHETYDLKGSAIGRIYPEELAVNNPMAILKDLNWVGRKRELALGPEKKALFEEQLRRDTELMQKLRIMDYSLLTGIHNVVRGNVDNLRDGLLTVFQPDTVKMRRKPTQVKRNADASALRKAVQRSDPKALSDTIKLPEHDSSERRMFLFYQDEGGIRATGDNNEDLGVIYYLGIIDILTPYTFVKKVEHFFRGLKYDKHMISAVPPQEYGERFMKFIYASIKRNDRSQMPKMYEIKDPPAVPQKDKTE